VKLEGVGIDLIEVARIAKLMNNQRFLQRCFTLAEIEYCFRKYYPERSLAARFAAKEAVGKALGVGVGNSILRWKDVEVVRGSGQPEVKLHGLAGELLQNAEIQLSLSHTKEFAAAMVTLKCPDFDYEKFQLLRMQARS
jgi:holo-[acyl-carrier protein] synthase